MQDTQTHCDSVCDRCGSECDSLEKGVVPGREADGEVCNDCQAELGLEVKHEERKK